MLDQVSGAARVVEVGDITVLGEPLETPEELRKFGPWTAPLELARQRDLPLWSDDAAVRMLAATIDVVAFGTPALLEALTRRALDAIPSDEFDTRAAPILEEHHELVLKLARDGVVDLPLTVDDVLALGAEYGWSPFPGALPLTRVSWWAWREDPLSDLGAVYRGLPESDTSYRDTWREAAFEGAAALRILGTDRAAFVLTMVGLCGFDSTPSLAVARTGLARAEIWARQFELGEVRALVPSAARFLQAFGSDR